MQFPPRPEQKEAGARPKEVPAVVPTDKGPPPVGSTGWLCHVDLPSLLMTSLKPVAPRAEGMSRDPANAGAVAFKRAGDPNVGEFSDAVVLKKFGDVPEDLSEL